MGAAAVSTRFGRSYALVVGVDDYRGGLPTLRNAVRDASAIGDVLEREHGFRVFRRFDQRATAASIRRVLPRVTRYLNADDRLIIYVASHGLAAASAGVPEGYILLHDARRGELDSFLKMSELREALERLPCRHVLVVLDCCFAGAFRWTATREAPSEDTVYEETFDRFCRSPAWQVLTSAASDQQALDVFGERGESENSPFATAFRDALAGAADYNADGLVTATEIYLFVRDRVELATKRQTPGLFLLGRHERGEFVFQSPARDLALPRAEALTEVSNPYRGLESYGESDRGLFFGRQGLIEQLDVHASARAFTAVVGPTGCGKSSVVRAGLIPRMRARGWSVLGPVRPVDALERGILDAPLPEGDVLVVIDQLEELLTQGLDVSAIRRFDAALARWLAAGDRVHVVVTARSDFEPRLQTAALADVWVRGRFVIPPMTQDQLRRAIEEPAALRELYFRPASIVDDLINEVAQMPGALPLLSFTLHELYRSLMQRHPDDRAITQDDVLAVGGVTRALTARAEGELAALEARDARVVATARNIMVRMVASIGGELARRRVATATLVFDDAAETARVQMILSRFTEARLLVAGDAGGAYIEPAHDGLVQGWPRLRSWLDASAGWLPLVRAVGDDVATWLEHDQKPAYSWVSDPRLPQLQQLAARTDGVLTKRELEFTRSSVRARRARRLSVGVSVAVAVAALGTAGAVAYRRSVALQAAAVREEDAQLASQGAQAAALARQRGHGREALAMAAHALAASLRTGRPVSPPVTDGFAAALATQRAVTMLPPHAREDGETWIACTANGATFATANDADGTLLLSDASGRLLHRIQVVQGRKDRLYRAAFAPDGKVIATATLGGLIEFWDVTNGSRIAAHAIGAKLASLAFSPDGTLVAAGDINGVTHLLSATSPDTALPSLQGHTDLVSAVAFSEDGAYLATGSFDKTVRVWSMSDRGLVFASPPGSAGPLDVALSPDGRYVAATAGPVSTLWDLKDCKCATTLGNSRGGYNQTAVKSIQFSHDGQYIMTAGADRSVRKWSTTSPSQSSELVSTELSISHARLCGPRLAIAASNGSAAIFDVTRGNAIDVWSTGVRSAAAVKFSPDGSTVYAGLFGHVGTWNVATHVAGPQVDLEPSDIWALGENAAGDVIAVSRSGQVSAVDLKGQRPSRTFSLGFVGRAFVSPDGRYVAAPTFAATVVWSTETGARVAEVPTPGSLLAAGTFSPDNQRVATLGEASGARQNVARVWSLSAGTQLNEITLAEGTILTSAAFSPDGRVLILGSSDGTAQVYDLIDQKLVGALAGHEAAVNAAVFSPDGSMIATASEDGTVRIWRTNTRSIISVGTASQYSVFSVAFSPDGKLVAAGALDGSVALYPTDLPGMRENACRMLGGAVHELDELCRDR